MNVFCKLKNLIFLHNPGNNSAKRRQYKFHYCAIRGFPKSGTNWVGNLLRLHPGIFVGGEYAFGGLARSRDEILTDLYWTQFSGPVMREVFKDQFSQMIRELMIWDAGNHMPLVGVRWICDQTPSRVNPIILDDQRIIYVVRDIRDVIVSRAYHLLRVNGTWGLQDFPRMHAKVEKYQGNLKFFTENPELLLDDPDWVMTNAASWAGHVKEALELRDEFEKSGSPELMVIKYEDLHADIESSRESMYRFLELDPTDAKALDSGKVKTTPGFEKEQPQQFYRKGAIGDWKNYFNEELNEVVQGEAGEILNTLSYELE